jgi:hypothetical protein
VKFFFTVNILIVIIFLIYNFFYSIIQGTGSSYSKATNIEIDRGAGYDDNDSFIDNTDAVSDHYYLNLK